MELNLPARAGLWCAAAVTAAVLGFGTATVWAEPEKATLPNASGALLPRDSRDAAVFRGGLVYANYCVTCHGINADGNGRAARLHNPRPANLRGSDKNDAYIGLAHDIFAFTMLQELMARSLGVDVGPYRHSIGSLHLYDSHRAAARAYLREGWQETVSMPPMPPGASVLGTM